MNIEKRDPVAPVVAFAKDVWSHPVGKVVISIGLAYVSFYVVGFGFRALAFTTRGFKDFTSALGS